MDGAETPKELERLEERAPEPPRSVAPVVVPRWIQLVLLPLSILGAWALVRAAGPVVLIFVVAGLIALLLNPFVALLRRARVPRGLAVGVVYVGLLTLIAIGAVLISQPVADQVRALSERVPNIVADADAQLGDFQGWLEERGIDIQVQEPGSSALETLGASLTEGTGELVSFTQEALTLLIEGSIALILVLVLSIYMLIYGERIGSAVRTIVPRGDGTPEDDFPTRIEAAVFGYVRGQLLFSTIMGTSAGVALYVMGSLGIFPDGKTYALFFGAWYGFAELIPYIGPAVGAAPPVLIALFSGEPLDALWLTIMFTALQQIEGHIVAPQVFAHSLRINPLLVIAALLLGGQLYGFIGAFVALPMAAVIRETVVYFRRHLVLEPWTTVPSLGLVAEALPDSGGAGPPSPPGAEGASRMPCPECGAVARPGARICAACGTELGDADAAAAAAASAPG
jgi:predicted PurR-regulated permease PerM